MAIAKTGVSQAYGAAKASVRDMLFDDFKRRLEVQQAQTEALADIRTDLELRQMKATEEVARQRFKTQGILRMLNLGEQASSQFTEANIQKKQMQQQEEFIQNMMNEYGVGL